MPTLESTLATLTAKFVSDLMIAMRSATIADLHSVRQGTRTTRTSTKPSKRRAPASKLALAASVAKKEQLQAALAKAGGNRSRAAQLLGVSRVTVHRKIVEFGIE